MGYNIIMIGPPGNGKTLLAKSLPGILPPLNFEESLETTKIYSVADKMQNGKPLMTRRPFRNPHHTTSNVALIGGGAMAKPGEVSLAHNGVLFLAHVLSIFWQTSIGKRYRVIQQPMLPDKAHSAVQCCLSWR